MIRWQIPFQSFNGTQYTVNIYDNDFTGTPIQLKGAGEPFVTDEDNDNDCFVPVRTQSGYIRFIVEGNTVLDNIMPTTATDRPVTLTNDTGTVLWQGFIKGEQYTQPWDGCPYMAELPVNSVLATMDSVYFPQDKGFKSIYDVLVLIDSYCVSNHRKVAADIFVSDNAMLFNSYTRNDNWQTLTTASDRRAFSTDFFECDSLLDVLKEWCTFYGMTCREYGDEFVLTHPGATSYVQITSAGAYAISEMIDRNISALDIKSTNNSRDYVQGYRSINGSYSTGEANDIVLNIGEFNDEFIPHLLEDTTCIYDNNDWIKAYVYGMSMTYTHDLSSSVAVNELGGQLVNLDTGNYNFKDGFVVRSQLGIGPTPFTAVKFEIPSAIYAMGYMSDMLRIEGKIFQKAYNTGAYIDVNISKIYIKLKVANMYLKRNSTTSYEWTTTETYCSIDIDTNNGAIKDRTIVTIVDGGLPTSTTMIRLMGKQSGFNVMLPIRSRQRDVQLEILANAEETRVNQVYILTDLKMNLINCNDYSSWVYSMSENVMKEKLSNKFPEDYSYSCKITTRQGNQHGSGLLRTVTGAYKGTGTNIEANGFRARKKIYAEPHEVLTIEHGNRFNPQDIVKDGQKRYAILSQSTNWREDKTTLKIIHYKTEEEEE